MSGNSQKSRLKDLIARGKEQGYLTYAEVNDHLPEDIADPDQVEDIIRIRVWCLFAHLDTHVVDHPYNVFNLIRICDIFRDLKPVALITI